ncbi:histidine kinase [Rhizobium oryzicola]|uniref:Histidine kinase n=1 Tax=Rhizobium oryzicola TaxID=1232668 RepID=A0ABT8SSD1_9HYPH|nr:histidine kinase [Rhizobium oryzicola]MDO1580938.1 histidine kinase [Rhizobium oryzicola]
MKKIFAAAAVAAMLFPAASFAKTLSFPSDAPVASITIPDSWNPEETDSGIQATSADNAIYLAVDVAEAADAGKAVDEVIAFLDKSGIKVDDSTQKKTEGTLNGMPLTSFDWTGKDKDGPVNISLAAIAPSADKLLLLTYWGTKGKDSKHDKAMENIIGSLKPAK